MVVVDVQEQFYEIGTCREMATEWIGQVKVLMSQQEGVMWFGGKSRVGQGRLPGRCQDSHPWGLGFGGWTCKHRTAGESERGLPVLDKIPGPGQRYEDQNKIKIGELVSVVVLLKKESRD